MYDSAWCNCFEFMLDSKKSIYNKSLQRVGFLRSMPVKKPKVVSFVLFIQKNPPQNVLLLLQVYCDDPVIIPKRPISVAKLAVRDFKILMLS